MFVETWSSLDVTQWLINCNLESCVDKFKGISKNLRAAMLVHLFTEEKSLLYVFDTDPVCLTPILRIKGPVLRPISIDLFVDKLLVAIDIPDFSCGVTMVMAGYFLFDIAYPKPLV
ncbi:uncharacterized protein LOC136073033 [Hydra vulgaris]|uniref:uncharacterized protein LOC136073033 n=1 Tax=Hydra vulgaris TaxID=6087 RepID=UPI0032EA3674